MDLDKLKKVTSDQSYVVGMRSVLNRNALFSDTTANFVSPVQPPEYGEVTIRFRAEKDNIDHVLFVHKSEKIMMFHEISDEQFDYYSYTAQLDNSPLEYYFEIHAGKLSCIYDRRGVCKGPDEQYYFRIIPGFRTPEWAKGAVFYQIFTDRFFNGDKSNDVLSGEYQYIGKKSIRVEDWDKYPDADGIREFYGGDLQGVLDKMDYLQDLGVDVIYFNPLFVSPSNHKYDIQDYDYIDPHFGKIVSDKGELLSDNECENRNATRFIDRVTNKDNLEASNELFIQVVKEAHRRGIKVILDGVFNHCGSFNKWIDRERIYENQEGYDKGAYIDRESPYHDFFSFNDDNRWPYNNTYDGWWGHETLPKLNYEGSRHLTDYVLYIAKKWVSEPYNVDGWRLDVAADLGHSPEFNHQFWQEFRRAVKSANPNAIILAEHYGSPKDWLNGKEWDTVMNYDAFMEPVTWFLTGMQKHSDDYREDMYGNADSFWASMMFHGTNFTDASLNIAMNELSNHDHSRFLTRTNKKVGRVNTLGSEAANEGVDKAVLREAVVIQMTLPGAPTLYYGDEVGVCGFTDPDNRRSFPWGHEDLELLDFHKAIIKIHKENEEFIDGSLKKLDADYNVIGYGRFTKNSQSLVLINNNDNPIVKEISVCYLGVPREAVMTRLIMTSKDGYTVQKSEYPVINGKVTVSLSGKSAIVIQYKQPTTQKFVDFG